MSRIVLPGEEAVQPTLFQPAHVGLPAYNPFPPFEMGPQAVQRIVHDCFIGHNQIKPLGLDLEYRGLKPAIIGVANLAERAACTWDSDIAAWVIHTIKSCNIPIVGHSVLSADRPVIESALDIKTSRHDWNDTLPMFYLLNQDWGKTPGKQEDDEDTGAVGLMNLYTMGTMYTDIYQYKVCREQVCYGPCPRHSVFDYCAADAWVALASYQKMKDELRRWGVPWQAYEELQELIELCELMKQRGVLIDREWVAHLEREMAEKKEAIFACGEDGYEKFNPRSPEQIKKWFTEQGIDLKNTQKPEIYKVLVRQARRRGILALGELGERLEEFPQGVQVLYDLYRYKDEGKGLKGWFDAEYIDREDVCHPRFNPCASSMNRLASSGPNFQNIPKRGFGKQVRKALVTRAGYDFLKADASNLEFRWCLHQAGYAAKDIPPDAFAWLVLKVGSNIFSEAARRGNTNEREVAKSVSHAGDYLEGLNLLSSEDFIRPGIKRDIEYGALKVFNDWEYKGRVVAFTGVNLADRLFGEHTLAARKKALEIQEAYFKEFSAMRRLHRKVLQEVEARNYVQSSTGRFLRLVGTAEEQAKMGVAFYGQGESALHVQAVMLRLHREHGAVPVLQVHDELVYEIPEGWTDNQAREFIRPMEEETWRFAGFSTPIKVERGKNWLKAGGENAAGLREI